MTSGVRLPEDRQKRDGSTAYWAGWDDHAKGHSTCPYCPDRQEWNQWVEGWRDREKAAAKHMIQREQRI